MRSSKYIIFFNSLLFLIQIQFVRSQLTTNGLVLNLDASDPSSYSGSGSTWNDTSGNNKDFNINTAIYNNDGYFVLFKSATKGNGSMRLTKGMGSE